MDIDKFKELLDDQNTWPDYYTFKFVVKVDEKIKLLELLSDHKVTEKLSSKGTYVSITSRMLAKSADDIVEVYRLVKTIEGVISL